MQVEREGSFFATISGEQGSRGEENGRLCRVVSLPSGTVPLVKRQIIERSSSRSFALNNLSWPLLGRHSSSCRRCPSEAMATGRKVPSGTVSLCTADVFRLAVVTWPETSITIRVIDVKICCSLLRICKRQFRNWAARWHRVGRQSNRFV